MIAGLATITPASGFVTIPSGFCIGLCGGVACYFAVTKLKSSLNYDDTLDVFGVHGVGSIVGMLLLGWLAGGQVNPTIVGTFHVQGTPVSLTGSGSQFLNQDIGVVFTAVYAGGVSAILFKVIDRLVGLRVNEEDEYAGLDVTQHGESAYSEHQSLSRKESGAGLEPAAFRALSLVLFP